MDRNALILVAGHTGLVGSAVVKQLEAAGYGQVRGVSRDQLDLRDQTAVRSWFERQRPQAVVLAAATVGGIGANASRPADFIADNLLIQTNVIDASHRVGVGKFVFLGSSCIYPRDAAQPMAEDQLLAGPLEPTNQWYAIAKIAGIKMVQAYRQQHGFPGICLMPTNLYGPGDNFDPDQGHVIPALMRRLHEAKLAGQPEVVVWGSGKPRREFLHAGDLARAVLLLLETYDDERIINIGVGEDISIAELARLLAETIGFAGQICFDTSKPDGAPRKLLDVSRIHALGWRAQISLEEGLAETYRWFCTNQDRLRG